MNPIPRSDDGPSPNREETVDEMITTEVSRHGPCTPAELLAAVGAAPSEIIARTVALVSSGVLRITPDGTAFTLRRWSA